MPWISLSTELGFRRVDAAPADGPLAHLHRDVVVGSTAGVLVVLSVGAGMSPEVVSTRLTPLAQRLAKQAADAAPKTALPTLRTELERALEEGAFARALPEVFAVVASPGEGLRCWRAGPNGFGTGGPRGVRRVLADQRFAALRRAGATRPGPWPDDLLCEVLAPTALTGPEALALGFVGQFGGGGLLLMTRGALPFDAPGEHEPAADFWARDAGWRHGMGASIIAVADNSGRQVIDDALDAWAAALGERLGTSDTADLQTLHAAAKRLLEGEPTVQFETARELAAQGGASADLLAFHAGDPEAPPHARLVAALALDEAQPRPLLESVAIPLLSTQAPPEAAYLAARQLLLRRAPATWGLAHSPDLHGVVMETGYPQGTHTLAYVADVAYDLLSTSLHAWDPPAVRAAGQTFLARAQSCPALASTAERTPRPGTQQVQFFFLGTETHIAGPFEESAVESDHPLTDLYLAAHALLSEIHALESEVVVQAHTLNFPDAAEELTFLQELGEDAIARLATHRPALGDAFRDALRILGFHVALGHPQADVVAALRTLVELGTGIFQRGQSGPDQTVTLSLRGQSIPVPGGVDEHTSAFNWLETLAAAIVLRDWPALESLCAFDPAAFEGAHADCHVLHARALRAKLRGEDGVPELLDQALQAAEAHAMFPELGQQVIAPLLRTTQAVLYGTPEAYRERLTEGLTAYRDFYDRPEFDHHASRVLPLGYVAICALAHQFRLPLPVTSPYVPRWLVEHDLPTTPSG